LLCGFSHQEHRVVFGRILRDVLFSIQFFHLIFVSQRQKQLKYFDLSTNAQLLDTEDNFSWGYTKRLA
jgi:hypothetical protein